MAILFLGNYLPKKNCENRQWVGPDSAKDEKCQNNYENRQTGWVRIYYTRNSRLV